MASEQHPTDHLRGAGLSGILAGAGLLTEATLWIASGWNPQTFADPAAALAYLQQGGDTLRWAVLAGMINLVFLAVFLTGIAARMRTKAKGWADVTLALGVIGIAAHLLVPMVHWYGVPLLLEAMQQDAASARQAWTAVVLVGHYAASGAGMLFMGFSMLATGWAAVRYRALPLAFGWVALAGGLASVLTVFEPHTPLSAVAAMLFMPSLALAVVFRIWGGWALLRG